MSQSLKYRGFSNVGNHQLVLSASFASDLWWRSSTSSKPWTWTSPASSLPPQAVVGLGTASIIDSSIFRWVVGVCLAGWLTRPVSFKWSKMARAWLSYLYIMHHNATYSVALRKVDAILFGHSAGRRFSPALRAHGITTWVSFSWTWQKSGTSDILSKGESFHITHTKTKTQCRCICRHLSWTFILNNSKFRLLSRIWIACKGCSNLTLQGRWKVQIGKFCQEAWPGSRACRESVGLPGPTVLRCRCAFWALLTEWMCREFASQRSVPKSLRTSPLVKNSSTRRAFQSVHRSSDPCAIKGWFPTGYTPWEFLEHPCHMAADDFRIETAIWSSMFAAGEHRQHISSHPFSCQEASNLLNRRLEDFTYQ